MHLLTAAQTWPFGTALAVLIGLAVIEGLGLFMGSSLSQWLDGFVPDIDHPDWSGTLGWLHVGKVPLLVLLILFLSGFAISGYALQASALALTGVLLPAWLAVIPAFFAGVTTVSGMGGLLGKIVPGDETSAVSELTLVGRSAVIVQGTAQRNLAAQAKTRDSNGRTHYVLVEPDLNEQTFSEGADVLLVRKVGSRFYCIANPHPELL